MIINSIDMLNILRNRLDIENVLLDYDEKTIRRWQAGENSPHHRIFGQISDDNNHAAKLLLLSGLKEQQAISQQALAALENDAPTETIQSLIDAGLAITAIDADYTNLALIGYETELLHTLGKLQAKTNIPKAIKTLTKVVHRAGKNTLDVKTQERQVLPVYITLAHMHISTGQLDQALAILDKGFSIAVHHNHGALCPGFAEVKALVYHKQNNLPQCESFVMQALASYIMLNSAPDAHRVMAVAKTDYKLQLNTYGMETLLQDKNTHTQHASEAPLPDLHTLGELLQYFHTKTGDSAKNIYQGLCTPATFTKLLRNDAGYPNAPVVEALCERMGYDINDYYLLIVPDAEFLTYNLAHKLRQALRDRQHEKATNLVNAMAALEAKKRSASNPVKQLISYTRARLYAAKNKEDHGYLLMLHRSLAETLPDFNKKSLEDARLSMREAVIIMNIASQYELVGEVATSLQLYQALLDNIQKHWGSDKIKSKLICVLLYNYSSAAGRSGDLALAKDLVAQGLDYGVPKKLLRSIDDVWYNDAYIHMLEGDKATSLPMFITAYHVYMMFKDYGDEKSWDVAKQTIAKNFNISL